MPLPTKTFLNLTNDKKEKILDAAINEFSRKQYEQVAISDIIRAAKIPRGSFYQYFVDKEDLYLHLIDVIKEQKLKFLAEDLKNIDGYNFIDLVKKLYDDGVKFAYKYPKYVKIMDFLLKNKNEIYEKIIAENMIVAENLYADLIEKDKQKGLIREETDTRVFAKMVVQLTSNIVIEELNLDDEEGSYKKMLERNSKVLDIIKFGVMKG
jgi:AcrR family transcriptional regulator